MRLGFLAGAVLLAAVAAAAGPVPGAVTALAQEQSVLRVNVSEGVYTEGETIVISGGVTSVVAGTPVIIQVISVDGNIIDVAQKTLAEDGSFTHTIIAQGPLWKKDGEYSARALYGTGNAAEASFVFQTRQEPAEVRGSFEVDLPDSASTTDVAYVVVGGAIQDMVIDESRFSLVVTINAPGDGALTVTLPRDSIDARTNGCEGGDEAYIVLVDDNQTAHQETDKTDSGRTVRVEFMGGDADIEIIGTCTIPEFGGVAAAALAAATVAAVALSRRAAVPPCRY